MFAPGAVVKGIIFKSFKAVECNFNGYEWPFYFAFNDFRNKFRMGEKEKGLGKRRLWNILFLLTGDVKNCEIVIVRK